MTKNWMKIKKQYIKTTYLKNMVGSFNFFMQTKILSTNFGG